MAANISRRASRIARLPDPTQYTQGFSVRNGALHCEGVAAAAVAARVGTPVYVYSRAAIVSAYRRLDRALAGTRHSICYSVKANSNLSILRLLARAGAWFDIVSGGELHRLRRSGVSPRRIVFSGVGKTREEIREALRANILLFNVESEGELGVLAEESARLRRPAPAGLRVNPDVAAGGHPHISTGQRRHKFGVDWEDARRLYREHKDSRWIRWQGISAHIGSQILSVAPFRRAVERVARFVRELQRAGIELTFFDIGGGVGIRYTDEQPLNLREYARVLSAAVRPLGCRLLLEPGRVIVGPAGVLLTRVLYVKQNGGKRFVVVDAAMNDFMRPALYDALHPITKAEIRNSKLETRQALSFRVRRGGRGISLRARENKEGSLAALGMTNSRADIVGPVCETGDCFLQDWPIGGVNPGDLLVIWGTGAYGMVGASNYNSRPRPAEVLVEGSQFRTVRNRESMQMLLRNE